jgi:thiaminase
MSPGSFVSRRPNSMPFSGRFFEYVLDRQDVQQVWHQFTHHEFVEGMGQGTLPIERFKAYLVQDYLYLVRQPSSMRLGEDIQLIKIQHIGTICPKQCACIIQGEEHEFNSSSKCSLYLVSITI